MILQDVMVKPESIAEVMGGPSILGARVRSMRDLEKTIFRRRSKLTSRRYAIRRYFICVIVNFIRRLLRTISLDRRFRSDFLPFDRLATPFGWLRNDDILVRVIQNCQKVG